MVKVKTQYDITIVGGGMVGASLACALGNQDFRIAIIENHNAKLDTPASYDDRAIALSYGTSQIFRTLGCWQELEAGVTPIKNIHVSDKGHIGVTRINHQEENVDALGYVITARELGLALYRMLSRFDNIDLISPAHLDNIEFLQEELQDMTGKSVDFPVDVEGADYIFFPAVSDYLMEADTLMGNAAALQAAGISWTIGSKYFDGINYGLFYSDWHLERIIIQLVKDEYKKGQISIPRLGQILRRMVPEVGELRRLMPKLKQTLLDEGMPLSEFAQLTQELGKELQNEELAQVLEKSAEEIGVAGSDLIDQIKYDPKGAAELIYLASEIRKGTGDEKVLSDLLVDYVERVGSNIAMDAAKQSGEDGNNHLREIVSQVESELMGRLKSKGVDTDVLNKVEQRLEQRMDQCLNKLETEWIQGSTSSATGESPPGATALQLFEKSVEGDAALKPILEKVRSSLKSKGIDENDYEKIYEEISKSPTVAEKIPKPKPVVRPPQKGLPPGALNRKSLLFFIEKEILRSLRYDTPFSIITFSILRATPRKPVRKGSITREHITNAVLAKLVSLFREVDIVGYLDKTKMISVLPMTEEKFGRKAMARVMKLLHEEDYYIGEIPIEIKFVAQVTAFDRDRTDTLKAFMKRAETDILNMANRLKNIQSLY